MSDKIGPDGLTDEERGTGSIVDGTLRQHDAVKRLRLRTGDPDVSCLLSWFDRMRADNTQAWEEIAGHRSGRLLRESRKETAAEKAAHAETRARAATCGRRYALGLECQRARGHDGECSRVVGAARALLGEVSCHFVNSECAMAAKVRALKAERDAERARAEKNRDDLVEAEAARDREHAEMARQASLAVDWMIDARRAQAERDAERAARERAEKAAHAETRAERDRLRAALAVLVERTEAVAYDEDYDRDDEADTQDAIERARALLGEVKP